MYCMTITSSPNFPFFNLDEFRHTARWTPKETSLTACRIKGFIMFKGGEQKAVLLHFTFVACAVFRRLDKQCCSEKQVPELQHSNDPNSQRRNRHKMPCTVK